LGDFVSKPFSNVLEKVKFKKLQKIYGGSIKLDLHNLEKEFEPIIKITKNRDMIYESQRNFAQPVMKRY